MPPKTKVKLLVVQVLNLWIVENSLRLCTDFDNILVVMKKQVALCWGQTLQANSMLII